MSPSPASGCRGRPCPRVRAAWTAGTWSAPPGESRGTGRPGRRGLQWSDRSTNYCNMQPSHSRKCLYHLLEYLIGKGCAKLKPGSKWQLQILLPVSCSLLVPCHWDWRIAIRIPIWRLRLILQDLQCNLEALAPAAEEFCCLSEKSLKWFPRHQGLGRWTINVVNIGGSIVQARSSHIKVGQ